MKSHSFFLPPAVSALIYEIRGITAAATATATLAHRAVCISPLRSSSPSPSSSRDAIIASIIIVALSYLQHSVTQRRQAVKCTFSSKRLCCFLPVAVPGPILSGLPVCRLEREREWHQFRGHGSRRSMSDAGVTCRPNTTGTHSALEEGRMIARSYRALFWTHTRITRTRPEHCTEKRENLVKVKNDPSRARQNS